MILLSCYYLRLVFSSRESWDRIVFGVYFMSFRVKFEHVQFTGFDLFFLRDV